MKALAGRLKFRNTILVYVEVGDFSVDCHATASAVFRNDRNLDSSFSTQNAQSLDKSQAAGFCDDFVGCQGSDKGATLSVVTAVAAADFPQKRAKANAI